MGRRVDFVHPSVLAVPGEAPSEAFERLWSRTRLGRAPGRDIVHLEADGVFLKGSRWYGPFRPGALPRAFRLLRETRSLLAQREAGLPVPEVVAHGVERRFGAPARALLAVRAIPGARDVETLLAEGGGMAPADRLRVFRAVGVAARRMHEAGFFHRDLYARNVLVRAAGGDFEAYLIDCPRCEVGRLRARSAFLRRADLFRFARDAKLAGASRAEIAAFAESAAPESAADLLALEPHWGRKGAPPWPMRLWLWAGLRPRARRRGAPVPLRPAIGRLAPVMALLVLLQGPQPDLVPNDGPGGWEQAEGWEAQSDA